MAKKTKRGIKEKIRGPKSARSFLISFGITAMIVYLGFSVVNYAMQINEVNKKLQYSQQKYSEIISENKETKNLLENAKENDIVERIARERLGYVFPDEKIYYDVN